MAGCGLDNGTDFFGQSGAGIQGALIRSQRKGVLLFATDMRFAGQKFRRLAHVQSADWIGEAELKTNARLEITRAKRGESTELLRERLRASEAAEFICGPLAKEQRHLRHALRAA